MLNTELSFLRSHQIAIKNEAPLSCGHPARTLYQQVWTSLLRAGASEARCLSMPVHPTLSRKLPTPPPFPFHRGENSERGMFSKCLSKNEVMSTHLLKFYSVEYSISFLAMILKFG